MEKPKIGQRWVYHRHDGEPMAVEEVCEYSSRYNTYKVKVIKIEKSTYHQIGQIFEENYSQFNSKYFRLMSGQDAPLEIN